MITKSLSDAETRQAQLSGMALEHLLTGAGEPLRVSIEQMDGSRAELVLPRVTVSLLSVILREQGSGKSVTVLATDTEMTPQQAAAFLRVSRLSLTKLLDSGEIPYRRVGPRRRVRLEDLLRYREQEEAIRHRGLDALVAEAQMLGLY